MPNIEEIAALAPGFEQMSEEERTALFEFAICWTVFEAQLFDSNVSAARVKDKVDHWLNSDDADPSWFAPQFDYFQARYTENGAIGVRFQHLHLRQGDDPTFVQQVLLGQNNEPKSQLAASLIIVLRFRNNFFHGLKWAYQFQDQQQNFEQSTQLMIQCTNRFGNR